MRIKYAVIHHQRYYVHSKVLCPFQLSKDMPVGEFIAVLSALTDVIIPASGDNVLIVAEEIRRGDKGDNKNDTDH